MYCSALSAEVTVQVEKCFALYLTIDPSKAIDLFCVNIFHENSGGERNKDVEREDCKRSAGLYMSLDKTHRFRNKPWLVNDFRFQTKGYCLIIYLVQRIHFQNMSAMSLYHSLFFTKSVSNELQKFYVNYFYTTEHQELSIYSNHIPTYEISLRGKFVLKN